jgi:hypothetical protein
MGDAVVAGSDIGLITQDFSKPDKNVFIEDNTAVFKLYSYCSEIFASCNFDKNIIG